MNMRFTNVTSQYTRQVCNQKLQNCIILKNNINRQLQDNTELSETDRKNLLLQIKNLEEEYFQFFLKKREELKEEEKKNKISFLKEDLKTAKNILANDSVNNSIKLLGNIPKSTDQLFLEKLKDSANKNEKGQPLNILEKQYITREIKRKDGTTFSKKVAKFLIKSKELDVINKDVKTKEQNLSIKLG
jgi:hypothetical protein